MKKDILQKSNIGPALVLILVPLLAAVAPNVLESLSGIGVIVFISLLLLYALIRFIKWSWNR